MVHSRFNEKETNPNPYINFITPLPAEDSEEARQFLRALAAQVRPVMKAHGFTINSLEEYEHNAVFAGRNWNNGETVELVLRRPGGSFLPSSWLMSTLCHELAHNKHMNHGPAFQVLWQKLRTEIRQLQDKGYYGDGYWSAGTRLADSAIVPGQELDFDDLPEYICGGAQSETRPSILRRRRGLRRPRKIVASNKTGRQTIKQRKAGSRVTSKYAFQGEGVSLSAGDTGKGFGKQASSKRAREERALAAESRLQSLASSNPSATHLASPTTSMFYASNGDYNEDVELVTETDADRKRALLNAENGEKLESLASSTSWKISGKDFIFTGQGRSNVTIDILSDEESNTASSSKAKGKRKADASQQLKETPRKIPKKASKISLGNIVKTEIASRKKEVLGMTPVQGKGRTVGEEAVSKRICGHASWSCPICTLENEPLHLICAACGTEKGRIFSNA